MCGPGSGQCLGESVLSAVKRNLLEHTIATGAGNMAWVVLMEKKNKD